MKLYPVVHTKFTNAGNIIIYFASEAEWENSAIRINSCMENIDIKFTKM